MHNLQEALNPGGSDTMQARLAALDAEETETVDKTERVIIVCNSLPLKMRADPEGAATRGHSWHFEMDPNSIYGQSASGIVSGTSVEKVIFLGGLFYAKFLKGLDVPPLDEVLTVSGPGLAAFVGSLVALAFLTKMIKSLWNAAMTPQEPPKDKQS